MAVDLLAPIKLNLNPYDIESVNGKPPVYVWEKWRYFIGYSNIIDKKNLFINTNEGYKALITDKLIKEFNNDPSKSAWAEFGNSYPYRGFNNPLTRNDIFAIQRFTLKSDPNVVIDGWLGTQTLQMNYPTVNIKVSIPLGYTPNPENYYPVIWGIKKYVIKVKDNTKHVNDKSQPLAYYLIPYNPAKHDGKLEGAGSTFKDWINLEKPQPTQSPEKTNAITEKVQNVKTNLQNQTKISKTF